MKADQSYWWYRVAARSKTWASVVALSLCCTAPAIAAPGVLLRDGSPGDSDVLAAGQQLLLEADDSALSFAGRTLRLQGFKGVLGYASELAYVTVLEGRVSDGTTEAGRGSMLMIPPYGAPPVVQRFDAARLLASWGDAARDARPDAVSALRSIADGQRLGLRFGRLGRTRLNVAAPDGLGPELARRSVKGEAAVQAIRFSGQGDMSAVEQQVVDRFLGALAKGDAETVAALMDPVPFGNSDLRGGASEARRLMAQALIDQRDWKTALAGVNPVREGQGNLWKLEGSAGGVLLLRPMGDFVFVRAIEMGGQS